MSSEEEDLQRIFFLECEELLSSAVQSVETLKNAASDAAINALFRAVHSIKGGAGAFGMDRLAKFAHAFESFMDLLRKGKAALDAAAVDLLFDGVDMLRLLVDESQNGTPAPAERYAATFAALRAAAGLDDEPAEEAGADFDPMAAFANAAPAVEEPAIATATYRIRFAPGPNFIKAGLDPLRIFAALKAMGDLSAEIDASALPAFANLDPEVCHYRWNLTLETAAPFADIDEVREMIDDLAQFEIEAPAAEAKRDKPVATVRVDVPKLERLGNMVGELIITQAFLARQAASLDPETYRPLFRALDDMSQHIRDLADAATAIRAQPLKVVFSRFGAIVRDLEKNTGKRVRLVVEGEATEIDKTVVERLSEPLTHLIRNSIDHGIESPEKREAAGKDPVGQLRLRAEQRGSQVVIELADDGAGVNRERVLAKAIERGLVAQGAALSDEEIDELIFLPGFSTADTVTSVSGRGVGMDAVRATIGEMSGRVALSSRPGKGTVFSLYLPLSLAVLDAMAMLVGRQNYLVPIGDIVESLRPAEAAIVRLDRGRAMLAWRGAMLRILSLGEEFGVAGAIDDPTRCILVVVRAAQGEMLALQVDDLIGQEPVVVKSLEKNFRKVAGISGATILGDGRPALILDPPSLGSASARRRRLESANEPTEA